MVQFGGDDVQALVFDFGTKTSKVGYAGEDTPRHVFPSHIGSTTSATTLKSKDHHDHIIGTEETFTPRQGLEFQSAFEDGLVQDWNLYEKLWLHSFKKLSLNPSEQPIILNDACWNTKQNREKLCELAFETFKLPGFYLGRSAVLSAFAAGRSTALVIESGHATTSVVPVFDGYIVKKAIQKANIGGEYISNQVHQFSKC